MKNNFNKCVIALIILFACFNTGFAATIDDFVDMSYTNPITKTVMKYRLFIPKNYDKTKQYPMVGFLHGAGQVDSNNITQITANNGALFWAADSIQKKYPSFILAPNSNGSEGYWGTAFWGDGNFLQESYELSESLENYINIINELKNKYSLDTNRLYSTGLSMGGAGTWASLTRFPNMFAAAIPI